MFFKFKPKNIEEVLEKLYPQNISIFRENKIDKRYYLDFFLNYFDISKEELTKKINDLTGIEYTNEIPKIDINFVKNNMLLEKYCFCPVFNDKGEIISFISSDPFLLMTKFNIDKKIPVYLSLAKDIVKKIDEVNKRVLINSSLENENLKKHEISKEALTTLIFELEQKNVCSVMLEKRDDSLFYSFKGHDNLWKKGEILKDIANDFLDLISNAKFEGAFFKKRNLKISKESEFLYNLSWNIPNDIFSCQKHIAFLSDDIELVQNFSEILKKHKIWTQHFDCVFDLCNSENFKEQKVLLVDEKLFDEFKEKYDVICNQNLELKKIVVGSLKKLEINTYELGADFFIDKMSSKEYIYEIIKSLL